MAAITLAGAAGLFWLQTRIWQDVAAIGGAGAAAPGRLVVLTLGAAGTPDATVEELVAWLFATAATLLGVLALSATHRAIRANAGAEGSASPLAVPLSAGRVAVPATAWLGFAAVLLLAFQGAAVVEPAWLAADGAAPSGAPQMAGWGLVFLVLATSVLFTRTWLTGDGVAQRIRRALP